MLIIHIIVALSSTLLSTYLIGRPSRTALRVSYAMIGATTISGVYLMIANPAYAIRGCIAYLAYTVFVTVLTLRAQHILAQERL